MTQLIGPELVRLAESFDHVASFGFMVEDTSRGSVRAVHGPAGDPATGSPTSDVAHIKRGIDVLAQVFFAAGARRVHTPIAGFDVLESPDDLARAAPRERSARGTSISRPTTRSAPRAWARDPASSVVGPDHEVHDTPGLYVVDGAAVPTSLGVNPQVTIMALATRAAEKIAAALA